MLRERQQSGWMQARSQADWERRGARKCLWVSRIRNAEVAEWLGPRREQSVESARGVADGPQRCDSRVSGSEMKRLVRNRWIAAALCRATRFVAQLVTRCAS